ncbi:MAG: c-type cytochrome [Gammaproteobacteria bacterium]|nr:c-type cytochrome [Gammaproteobacteria bacterium]
MNGTNKIAIAAALLVFVGFILWLVFATDTSKKQPSEFFSSQNDFIDGSPLIQPIPDSIQLDPIKVALGEKLFKDPRLSNSATSCNSCHNLHQAGIDGLKISINVTGGMDEMNTPTVFNSGLYFKLLWNGFADSLEDQIEGSIQNPKHMNSNWPDIIKRLQRDSSYVNTFNVAYEKGITATSIKNAIATFERSLITPHAPFDLYLKGDENAINEDQKAGFVLFKDYGCISCHQGIAIGANLFARFGVFDDAFKNKKELTATDLGRYAYTNDPADKHVFKVPSLRNIALTAPYFHDGSSATLEEAIARMAKAQLGRTLDNSDIKLIAAFLESLTGTYKGRHL